MGLHASMSIIIGFNLHSKKNHHIMYIFLIYTNSF
jgi:hypothetical protein